MYESLNDAKVSRSTFFLVGLRSFQKSEIIFNLLR